MRAAAVVRALADDALACRRAEHAGPVREQPRHIGGNEVLGVVGVEEFDPLAREIEVDLRGRIDLRGAPGLTCCHRSDGRPSNVVDVRLGVLDVGSNTVHLLVVDAHRGGHPTPMSSTKSTLRLAENMDDRGDITTSGADRLVATVAEFAGIARTSGCGEMMAFATSAVRDAEQLRSRTGPRPRRGRGRSRGAVRRRRSPADVSRRAPLVRLERRPHPEPRHRRRLARAVRRRRRGSGRRVSHSNSAPAGSPATGSSADPPGKRRVAVLRDWLDAELVGPAKAPARTPATRTCASAPRRRSGRWRGSPARRRPRRACGSQRTLTASGLRQLIAFISRMTAADRAELEGVSSDRSQQIVAGALVAEASMRALGSGQTGDLPVGTA